MPRLLCEHRSVHTGLPCLTTLASGGAALGTTWRREPKRASRPKQRHPVPTNAPVVCCVSTVGKISRNRARTAAPSGASDFTSSAPAGVAKGWFSAPPAPVPSAPASGSILRLNSSTASAMVDRSATAEQGRARMSDGACLCAHALRHGDGRRPRCGRESKQGLRDGRRLGCIGRRLGPRLSAEPSVARLRSRRTD
eukprot:366009-Chlamydomonas_euryale.AAC.8